MNYLYRISFITFLLGVLVFAYRNQWVIIRFPWEGTSTPATHSVHAHKKQVRLWHYQKDTLLFESQQLIWDDNATTTNISRLINAYLHLLYEENSIDKKIQVTSVTLNPTGTELYVNFSHELFHEEEPIHRKWMLIEGLLQTIREQIPEIKTMNFLTNHHPLSDHHLDFSRPWPIEGFMSTAWQAGKNTHKKMASDAQETVTIMLEPAGDAQYTGRIIDDVFERGISLQCVQELKKILESLSKNSRVILSRFPGETVEPLQNAAFANRLNTHLYIMLSMYQLPKADNSLDPLTEINIYHCLYHPITDFWQRHTNNLACEPYHQAHVAQSIMSKEIAHNLSHNLQQTKPLAGRLHHCAGLPVKPLLGIVAPAIIIELGLSHKNGWQALILQLAQQINNLLS